ncbi:MAG: efflux RND transporter periplasmic adaptor subunit [Blastochloris viridis]|uniref:Efflux RND transporter periplasmic adaptor subunit n=1 Tax=Blastochloris viridis TaxID=1079 RepID=A0A6N4RBM2_BLAVI|nr:MAG: efflux RND transporter periplasmic adaptor subunit [Blastochloris viridis]
MVARKRDQQRNMRMWGGVLGVAVLALAAWWWFGKAEAPKPQQQGGGGLPVEVVTAVDQPIAETLTVAGQVQARIGAELRSEVTARVVSVTFIDGEAVKRGEPLLVLDDSVQRATLAQAQANYALAKANVERYSRLVGLGAASRLQVDTAEAEAKLQRANIQMARANLAKYQVAAPFDGAAGIAQVNVGELVQPGELLVAVTDNAKLKVTFKVPEAQATSLRLGAPVKVTSDGAELDGVIDALDGRVDPTTRTLEGKVALDNDEGKLVAGQFVRVRVPVREVSEAVVIPDQALIPQGAKMFVFVITAGENGATMASRTTVEVGLRTADKAQIVKGVEAGQRVVTAGQQKLQAPLMPVTPLSPTTINVAPQAVEELR